MIIVAILHNIYEHLYGNTYFYVFEMSNLILLFVLYILINSY